MSTQPDRKYPEILDELAAMFAATIVDDGFATPEAARASSLRFADRVRRELGGQKVYIPRGRDLDVEAARRAIAERFTGNNIRELCRDLDISESRFRQLHAEVVRARRAGQ